MNSRVGGPVAAHWIGRSRIQRHPGFALVASLMLMMLLVLVGLSLLTLSSTSLSISGRDADLAEARANARMALSLAIAQLQKHSGPDQRISAPADQISSGDGTESSVPEGRRHWTGIYRSWSNQSTSRPEPEFLSWMVSGEPNDVESRTTAVTGATGGEIQLVGASTAGQSKDRHVYAPALGVVARSGGTARIAWWAGDQGVKAAMATPPIPEEDDVLASVRAGLQSAPRNAVELASVGSEKPFVSLELKDPRLQRVTGWQQSGFLASNVRSPRELFHDLAPFSTGLLTNVRNGGFRKDLSMALERTASQANSQLASNRTALYRVGGENGINLLELWGYYNLYKEVRTTGSHRFTTGGTLPSGTPYLMVESSPSACVNDDEFFYKQPTIISYQMVLSLQSRMVNNQNQLHIVSDPILTFWNPLDIPVVVPTTSFFSVKYWAIPYDIVVSVNGVTHNCPLIRSFSGADSNFISLVAGNNVQQLVFKPGEVIKVSQSGNMIVRTGAQTDHQLQARAGFNFGGGISYPLRNDQGQVVTLPANATVRYSARPNGFTAGQSGSSGLVPPGYTTHTRHFSTTHHEVYVGYDRKGTGASLGYGGMFVDWDFGNRRVKATEVRSETQPGTKPANQRLYANRHPQVFRPITESMGRPLTAAELAGGKAPIMIVSYNAKTETGTEPDARTRYLGRFNPKAHHVDFYDLSQQERDILPYEYSVDPLVSWKNRFLETSTNGNAYFGGGLNAEFGSSFVTTHSIPREPIVSLGALQHSFANGFEMLRPKDGYATLNAREPLLPQISHAIGNSAAPPMLSPSQTEGTLTGGRPIADHSYLSNLNLWDDWFFSGVAPQTTRSFARTRNQRAVAQEFLEGTGKLPVVRYQPDTTGESVDQVLSSMFSGASPTETATQIMASLIRVDGLFNVNSTSVEAWKAVLGALKDRPVIVRSTEGAESIQPADADQVPVAGLMAPRDLVTDGRSSSPKDEDQWVGRRQLDEGQIDQLARALVREVRKRGPFLSLADFVNRRPGSDRDLAKAGAVQAALDSNDVEINSAWQRGDRAVPGGVAGRFAFPEAESGPMGYGMPGIVKQADILTPIAPVLSARSDSFIIRAYGESVDKNGKVQARAWCEAVVERSKRFIDDSEEPGTVAASLKEPVNVAFGRRYEVISFRWLHPSDI